MHARLCTRPPTFFFFKARAKVTHIVTDTSEVGAGALKTPPCISQCLVYSASKGENRC